MDTAYLVIALLLAVMVAFSGVGKLRRDTRIIGADIVTESITPATAGFEARPNGQARRSFRDRCHDGKRLATGE
jgi:hypothetical protein